MRRVKTARSYASESQDGEFDRVDSEMLKLKTEYRNIINAKKAEKARIDTELHAQKFQIEQLKREKTEYELDYSIADCSRNNDRDMMTLTRMQTNLQKKANLVKTIEDERALQMEIEAKCKEMEKKINLQRQRVAKSKIGDKTSIRTLTRHIDIAEGNLHREASKFNSILAHNVGLRDRITTLRHEKDKFKTKFALLTKKYEENKNSIVNIVEVSTMAFEAIVDTRNKIKSQQEKAFKELQQFTNDITAEERKIDHEKRQQSFMNTKGLERDDSERGARERQAAKALQDERNQLLVDLETSWNKIVSICSKESEDDISVDTAIRKFKESEDANFALFNFVSDQNNDIEKMTEELDTTAAEQFQNQMQLRNIEQVADKQLSNYGVEKEKLKLDIDSAESKLNDELKTLQKISDGVLTLFNKLDCQEEDLGIALKTDMQDDFISMYLAVIEAKLNTLLSVKIYLRSQDPDNDDEFTPADAVREVLGKVEQPKIIQPPINNLFDIQYQNLNNQRTNSTSKLTKDEDTMVESGVSIGEDGGAFIQTTGTRLGQIATTGEIMSLQQLKDKVKTDISNRRTSFVITKGNTRRTSVIKPETMIDISNTNEVSILEEGIVM